MNRLRILAALPLWFVLIAATPLGVNSPTPGPVATTPTPTTPPPTPPPTPSPSPPPSPSPSPNPNAFLTLDITSGGPETLIAVNGSGFFPNEPISLYWDQPTRVSGATTADPNGNFTWKVKPFPGDASGVHKLCASAPPSPCANFTLQAPTPTPSPSPSPSPEPTPSASPIALGSPAPVAERLNGLDIMLKPPFVILPIIAGVGLALALMYWVLSIVMRPKPQVLKSVTVGHLASRPDYSAGFGTPPPVPAPAPPPPSAWPDLPPPSPAVEVPAEEVVVETPPAEIAGAVPPQADPLASPAVEWTGEASGQPDPLLAAWADVLPASGGPVDAAPAHDGESSPKPETKPPASHDDPLDFPEPGD
ncbi:MAG: hypothetical protein NVS1B3_05840 [Candidatus Dormibacteraceae bacterium]